MAFSRETPVAQTSPGTLFQQLLQLSFSKPVLVFPISSPQQLKESALLVYRSLVTQVGVGGFQIFLGWDTMG